MATRRQFTSEFKLEIVKISENTTFATALLVMIKQLQDSLEKQVHHDMHSEQRFFTPLKS